MVSACTLGLFLSNPPPMLQSYPPAEGGHARRPWRMRCLWRKNHVRSEGLQPNSQLKAATRASRRLPTLTMLQIPWNVMPPRNEDQARSVEMPSLLGQTNRRLGGKLSALPSIPEGQRSVLTGMDTGSKNDLACPAPRASSRITI